MKPRRPIVVGTDFSSTSRLAFDRAAELAGASQSPLVVAHIVSDAAVGVARNLPSAWAVPPDDSIPRPRRVVERSSGVETSGAEVDVSRYDAALARVAERLPVSPKLKVRVGPPFEQIAAVADEENAALIVAGAHAEGGMLEAMFLGSTAERVLRIGHRPVLLARRHPETLYDRILVAVDLSDQALRVLVFVRDLLPTATVTVMHCLPPEHGTSAARKAKEIEEAKHEVARLVGAAGYDPDGVELCVMHAEPREAISRAAQERHIPLIVMGTHARTGVGRLLFGSTAEHVFRTAIADVLAIPPNHA